MRPHENWSARSLRSRRCRWFSRRRPRAATRSFAQALAKERVEGNLQEALEARGSGLGARGSGLGKDFASA
jgi:hypothetical protein